MYVCECWCPRCKEKVMARVQDPGDAEDGQKLCPDCGTPLEFDGDYWDEDDFPRNC